MTLWQAFILGIVEGVTEFLPISSTFHLIFANQFLGMPESAFTKFFDVFIQAGAILPVLIIYYRDWFKNHRLWFTLAASFIPTAIVGFLLHDVIKGVFFESNQLMLGTFAVVGVLFIVVEALIRKKKVQLTQSVADMSYVQAVIIGTVQACAVLPGVSRAGAVMIAMMLLGFKRDEAAKYSFMLAVPTILAAAALDVLKSRHELIGHLSNVTVLGMGFAVAFFSSWLILQWFINYLRKNSLQGFGIYRLLVAAILIVMGFWR